MKPARNRRGLAASVLALGLAGAVGGAGITGFAAAQQKPESILPPGFDDPTPAPPPRPAPAPTAAPVDPVGRGCTNAGNFRAAGGGGPREPPAFASNLAQRT